MFILYMYIIHIAQNEETIKHLKETIEIFKRENTRLKTEIAEMNKLKEEKMVLSKQIMDLESEAMLYKKIESSEDLLSMNATTNNKLNKKRNYNVCSFGFSYVNNLNRMKIKDSLKNKNEEILILKNELVQKERLITNLQKKYNNNKHNDMLFCNGDIKFGNVKGFEKNKSEGDFMKKVHVVLVKKYFDVENEGSARKERKGGNNIGSNSNMKNGGFQGRKRNVGTYGDEGDDESQSLLENNIYSEIKNILEEKRNFILQTMTYENFSFDIICKNERMRKNEKINYFPSGSGCTVLPGSSLSGSFSRQGLCYR